MTREKAYQILTKYLKNPSHIKHCLACEAAMKNLYWHLSPNGTKDEEEKWGIVGLLHDGDYEIAQKSLDRHGLMLFEKEPNIPNDIKRAIQAHNPLTGIKQESQLDWGIYCVDQLTGLIVAAALVRPDKKLESLTSESVLKRMQEKAFAKGARREMIYQCEQKLGIPLKDFVDLTLKAMQEIHEEIGL